MGTVEKFLGTSLLLIFVFLVLTGGNPAKPSAGPAVSLISGLGASVNNIFRTLQGR